MAAVAVLPDEPDATPWTVMKHDAEPHLYLRRPGDVEVIHTETSILPGQYHRRRPSSGWCFVRPRAIRPTSSPSPRIRSKARLYRSRQRSSKRLPMPELVRDALEAFVAEHHVEQTFFKRKRDRPDTEALARRRTGEAIE